MIELISFGNAMVAHEQGKTVQYYNVNWRNLSTYNNCSLDVLSSYKWRINPEPVKYSVDMWLDRIPEIDNNCHHLDNFLFGKTITYSKNKTEVCNKKCKITVEMEE